MPTATTPAKKAVAKKVVAKKVSAAPTTNARRRKPKVEKTERPHPLAALIPDDNYEGYVSRRIGGVLDLDVLHAARQERHNVAIFGPTGCAKTTLVYAYGHREGLPVVNIPCNGAADPDMLFGGWRPTPNKTYRLVPGPLYYATRYGGVVLYDEITFMPAKIAALAFPALDARRMMIVPEYDGGEGCGCEDIETGQCPNNADGQHVAPQLDKMGNPILSTYKCHVDCLFVSTWNPGYAGTYSINEALYNRFNHKMKFDYNPDVEGELIESPTLIEFAQALRVRARSGDITTPVSTNALMELESNAANELLGPSYAIENFLAAFKDTERDAVMEAMKNYTAAIMTELQQTVEDDEELVSDEDFNADEDEEVTV